MKFGVVVFPGSGCDRDLIYTFKNILDVEVVSLWHNMSDIQTPLDGILVPGGFAYGNYLRAGALACHSPIIGSLKKYAEAGGFILGIGNGFQILCEAGLLSGVLLPNNNQKFICKNTYIVPDSRQSCLTSYTPPGSVLKIPIAHDIGRYYASRDVLAKMRLNGQILFRYSDERGNISQTINPDGSVENIAGVCNKEKNVYGMMPHPERAVDDELGNTDGLIIFNSLIKSLKEEKRSAVQFSSWSGKS